MLNKGARGTCWVGNTQSSFIPRALIKCSAIMSSERDRAAERVRYLCKIYTTSHRLRGDNERVQKEQKALED